MVSFRRASLDDAPALAEFGARVFVQVYEAMMNREDLVAYVAEAFTGTRIQAELSDGDQVFFLAEDRSGVVGFCKLRLQKPDAQFERSYVDPRVQGQGIGRRFFELRLDEARAAGCTGAWLSVWDRNLRAIEFHRKMGFEIVGEEPFQVGRELQRDWLMRRII